MDTSQSVLKRLRLNEIDRLLATLSKDTQRTHEIVITFFSEMEDDARKIKIVLPIPATREMCLHAAEDVRSAFDELLERYRLRKESIRKRIEQIVDVYNVIGDRLDLLALGGSRRKPFMATKDKQVDGWAEASGMWLPFLQWQREEPGIALQNKLQALVKHQDEELKRWFQKRMLREATSHIKIARSTRPGVDMNVNVSRNPLLGSSLKLPAEIMATIYDSSSLETCVALRQVNKDWYVAFRNLERVMERKMQERNPWIKPGDPDLLTWADCVLVFAGRLRSGKWKTTEHPEDLSDLPEELVENRLVVGVELGLDEKLPANFSGMFDEPDHVYTGYGYNVDLWTLASSEQHIPSKERLCENVDGIVIRYGGIDITLDPSTTSGYVLEVHKGKTTIQVLWKTTLWLFSQLTSLTTSTLLRCKT